MKHRISTEVHDSPGINGFLFTGTYYLLAEIRNVHIHER